MSYILLTGATGLLGRYLVRELLDKGPDSRLAVLVRAGARSSAAQRLEEALQIWDRQLGRQLPRPVIVEGDIGHADLGLSARDRTWVAHHCHAIFHNAASLTFQAPNGRDGEPWQSNLEGTRHVLDLAKQLRIRKFFHVSTAYTCGLRAGTIFERELDEGQDFGNDYERSKVEAERLVQAASYLDQPTVFRPSIIVGDSLSGYTSTFHGFYAPLQLAQAIIRYAPETEPGQLRFLDRLQLAGAETKNFVPVDWVAAVMAHVVRHSQTHGHVYHLTSPEPLTVDFLQQVILEAVLPRRDSGAAAPAAAPLPPGVELESMFRERLMIYESYWRDDPTFDRTNTLRAAPHLPCPRLDRDVLGRMARFALETQFGWPKPPAATWEFDVASHLARHSSEIDPAATSDSSAKKLGLRVLGPGGGEWTWVVGRKDEAGWHRGIADNDLPVCALTAANFQRLLRGDVEVRELFRRGRVAVVAQPESESAALQALSELCTRLGRQDRVGQQPGHEKRNGVPAPGGATTAPRGKSLRNVTS